MILRMEVFLLHHINHAANPDGTVDHVDDNGMLAWNEQEGDSLKLLGVYSSEQAARARIERARSKPGFDVEPDCFLVEGYLLDEDQWTEGFISAAWD